MTSKSSFLVNLRTNARRRTWNTVLFATGFFFLLPVSLFISLSSTVKYTEQQYLAERLTDVFKSLMILNPFTVMATIVFAVIAAIHGFSYLYSKKKVDMYSCNNRKTFRRNICKQCAYVCYTVLYIFCNFFGNMGNLRNRKYVYY